MAKGRYPEINLLNLIIKGNQNQWNAWLYKCEQTMDMEGLAKVLSGIQQGMDTLVKQKLNTDNLNLLFLKMQRSIETSMKNVWRRKYRIDNMTKEQKQKSNAELEVYLRGNRY